MCVVVERTYVSCLIRFRTFPFVYYKMCKYTLLWGFWWIVRVRLCEWENESDDRVTEQVSETVGSAVVMKVMEMAVAVVVLQLPIIRYPLHLPMLFMICNFQVKWLYALGSCRYQLGRGCIIHFCHFYHYCIVLDRGNYAEESLPTNFERTNIWWNTFWLWISTMSLRKSIV